MDDERPATARGWYLDATDPGVARYWDGERWTGHLTRDRRFERLARGVATPDAPAVGAGAEPAGHSAGVAS
ncbi:MAG: hypothetical protein JWO37_1902 [Acidimicrobiales bacterium]|nr:hypothetical protein [Acidimicrobiales bacterium]